MPWFEHKDIYVYPQDPTREEIAAKIGAIDFDANRAAHNLQKAWEICERLGIGLGDLVDNPWWSEQ